MIKNVPEMFSKRFSQKTRSGLKNYGLGPKISDSSSKTTHIVLFPGLNSPIQVKITVDWISDLYAKNQDLNSRFLAFFRVPGGLGELREADRNHFHLSWYLSVSVVRSYGQTPLGGILSTVYGMNNYESTCFWYCFIWIIGSGGRLWNCFCLPWSMIHSRNNVPPPLWQSEKWQ